MRRIVFLLVALAGVLVCAPADAGCGRLRLPNPVKWLKQHRAERSSVSAESCPCVAQTGVCPCPGCGCGQANRTALSGDVPTVWAAGACANGNCSTRGRRK